MITGGSGGIGRAIAAELLARHASVLLIGRNAAALKAIAEEFAEHGDRVATFVADLTHAEDRLAVCRHAQSWNGGIDTLINGAGVSHFTAFEDHRFQQIDLALTVNVEAPLHLCLALLPHLRRQPQAHIVNIGSVYGALGYPGYATYSATKFALRGFSEALRRELADTHVKVHYLAPRSTRTAFNSSSVERMNRELGVSMDAPSAVAKAVCRLMELDRAEAVVGWPEKIFVRINAVLPRLVDFAIRKQLPVIQRYMQKRDSPHPLPEHSWRAAP